MQSVALEDAGEMCRSRCSPSVHLISISVASTMCQTLFCPDRRGCTWSGPSSGRGTGIPQRSCRRCRPTGRGQTCAPAAASSSDRAPWLPSPAWAAKDPDRLVNSGNVLWLLLGFYQVPTPVSSLPSGFLSLASRQNIYVPSSQPGTPSSVGAGHQGDMQQPAW